MEMRVALSHSSVCFRHLLPAWKGVSPSVCGVLPVKHFLGGIVVAVVVVMVDVSLWHCGMEYGSMA